ncbi:MAG TPA: CoA pyrophosphatase [Woeseiaceae bacterium]|nr:CoA pyrophosphatase [Woeseiaceae bacterium]
MNRKLSARDIRERLADTSQPKDPLRIVMPERLRTWPPEVRENLTTGLKPAGVLIPIIEHEESLTVLLTRRSSALRYHASQVSFPGGRMEAGDADIRATALRETWEEVGIQPADVDIAGYLEPTPTITGYAVTAVVGIVRSGVELRIDPNEVERAFEVPLAYLLDVANERASEREWNGLRLPIVEFHFASERSWGATANILLELRQRLLKA